MFVLLTVRSFSYDLLTAKVDSLISSLGDKLSNVGFAIDSRGEVPTLEEWRRLTTSFPSLSLSYSRSSDPGKSAAQRHYALTNLQDGQFVLLNDLRCDISASNMFVGNLSAFHDSDVVSFPVVFDSVVGRKSLYFSLENKLRSLEDFFGICFVSSGQLMLVKSDLLRFLPSDVGDDCFLPLYAQLFSNGVSFSSVLEGHDFGHTSSTSQYAARRRMVVRNLPYTFSSLLTALYRRRLLLAFAIFFHKIFRWLGLFLMPILLLILFLFLIYKSLLFSLLLVFLFVLSLGSPKVRNAAFGLLGIFVGFYDILLGKRISFY